MTLGIPLQSHHSHPSSLIPCLTLSPCDLTAICATAHQTGPSDADCPRATALAMISPLREPIPTPSGCWVALLFCGMHTPCICLGARGDARPTRHSWAGPPCMGEESGDDIVTQITTDHTPDARPAPSGHGSDPPGR